MTENKTIETEYEISNGRGFIDHFTAKSDRAAKLKATKQRAWGEAMILRNMQTESVYGQEPYSAKWDTRC